MEQSMSSGNPNPSAGSQHPAAQSRRIKSMVLEALVRDSNGVLATPLRIENAVIEGPLNLTYAVFRDEVSLTNCTFTDSVDLSFARFERSVSFGFATFEKESRFRACTAQADFFLSYATFLGPAVFEDFVANHTFIAKGVKFQGLANFRQAKFQKSIVFSPSISISNPTQLQQSTFAEDADFSYSEISGPADFEGSVFLKEANFNRMRVNGAAYFSCYDDENAAPSSPSFARTRFEGYTTFSHAVIDGTAFFKGVEFADSANFERAVIGGHALFQTLPSDHRRTFIPVHFKKDAKFLTAQIGANAEFDGACFDGEVSFERITIGRNALFRSFHDKSDLVRTTFKGVTSFLGGEIKGSAEFFGAHFLGYALFSSIQVSGNAMFDPLYDEDDVGPVQFFSNTDFDDTHFRQQVWFSQACFYDTADFSNIDAEGVALFKDAEFRGEVKFTTGHFKNQANFERARFLNDVDFRDLKVDGNALFNDAQFRGEAILNGASFKSFHLRDATFRRAQVTGRSILRRRIPGNVDLVGATYDFIECDIDNLFNSFGTYDRQPYVLLEKTIRSSGQDREADNIYYAAKTQEGLQLWQKVLAQRELKHLPRAISNQFQKIVFRFGIRPYRLIVYSLIVLILGVIVFSHEGAVMHKDKKDRDQNDDAQLTLTQADAINVSLRQFVPILELPIAGDYVPSDRPAPSLLGRLKLSYAGYATLHRLFGFLLIPLGLASLTGVIQRRKPQ